MAQKFSKMNSLVLKNISSAMVVKANIAERLESAKFKKANKDLFTRKMQQSKINVLLLPTRRFATLFSMTMIYFIGGRGVIDGNLTLGALMVFIGYARLFYGPIGSISTVFTSYQKMAVSAERILKVLDTQPDVLDAPNALSLPRVCGHVKFDNVSFTYDDEKKVLNGVSLEAMPGEITGIIGPSGSGKSTLMHLLCRLYDVSGGTIMLDGYDIAAIKIHSLRKQIAVILQDTLLFYATIAENIAYAKPDASRDEIIAVTKAAGAHNFIMRLPDAYDTIIGESGAGLSAGEKQRIAIARALLRDPKIIIFDEATSALDSESEAVIYATIKKLAKRHTIFVISHRVSALNELADKVLVMKNGRISEFNAGMRPVGEIEVAEVSAND
jgi:ABC-type multidrug transport system fused ATPase/permease subunit